MKAALNGVPQLSTMDGWWEEGFNGHNGWAIAAQPGTSAADEDAAAADQLYELLETAVGAGFYNRDTNGLPQRWIQMMRTRCARRGAVRVAAHAGGVRAGLLRAVDPGGDRAGRGADRVRRGTVQGMVKGTGTVWCRGAGWRSGCTLRLTSVARRHVERAYDFRSWRVSDPPMAALHSRPYHASCGNRRGAGARRSPADD